MNRRRIGALATSALAAALVLASTSLPKRAAAADPLCSPEQSFVFDYVETVSSGLAAFASEQGADPDDRECSRICRPLTGGCRKTGNTLLRFLRTSEFGVIRAVKKLCVSAENRSRCKSDVREIQRDVRDMIKDTRNNLRKICTDDVIVDSCEDFCTDDVEFPASCDELFFPPLPL